MRARCFSFGCRKAGRPDRSLILSIAVRGVGCSLGNFILLGKTVTPPVHCRSVVNGSPHFDVTMIVENHRPRSAVRFRRRREQTPVFLFKVSQVVPIMLMTPRRTLHGALASSLVSLFVAAFCSLPIQSEQLECVRALGGSLLRKTRKSRAPADRARFSTDSCRSPYRWRSRRPPSRLTGVKNAPASETSLEIDNATLLCRRTRFFIYSFLFLTGSRAPPA